MKHAWKTKRGIETCQGCGAERQPHPKLRNRHLYRQTQESEWLDFQSPCLGGRYRVERISHRLQIGIVRHRGQQYAITVIRYLGCGSPFTPYDVKWEWRCNQMYFKPYLEGHPSAEQPHL